MFKLGMMFSTNADKISPKVSKLSKDFNSLGRNVKQGDKDFSKYFKTLKKHDSVFNNLSKDANRASLSISRLTKGMGGLVSSYAIGKVIGDSIQASIDMIETTNLFSVAMGNLAVETNDAVVEMNRLTGLDSTNIQSTIGTYNLLARSMGISAENSQILSTNTQKLALDLSSLTNVPLNQVMQDLRSGLVGQSETVYKYGLDITEATLKQEAMLQGIDKSVRNMSQGEKVALRYSAMIRQSALSHGDFAKTINTPANQMKIFTERTATLARAFGSLFIPAIEMVLPYLNAFLQVLTQIIQAIALMVGYVPPAVENMNNSFGGIEDGAEDSVEAIGGIGKALKDLNNHSLGMDELNVINPQTDSKVGGVSGGDSPFDLQLDGYDNLISQVSQKSDEIVAKMKNALNSFKELAQPTIDAFGKLWSAVGGLGEVVIDRLLNFYEKVLKPIGEWALTKGVPVAFEFLANVFRVLTEVLKALQPSADWLIEKVLVPLGSFVADLFVETMTVVNDLLSKFVDWISNNQDSVRGFTDIVTGFFLAWKAVELMAFIQQSGGIVQALNSITGAVKAGTVAKLADKLETIALTAMYAKDFIVSIAKSTLEIGKNTIAFVAHKAGMLASAIATGVMTTATTIWTTVTTIATTVGTAFGAVLTFLTSPIGLVVVAIGALIAIGVLLYQNWETVQTFGVSVWGKIQQAWKDAGTWFNTNVVTPLSNAFNTLKTAWGNMCSSFGNAFKGVVNTVLGIAESMINGLIDGINDIINKIQNLINKANQALSALGMNTIYVSIRSISHVRLPRLARGGSLADGQLFQAGEFGKAEIVGQYNNKTTVMPLENSGFVEAMYQAVYQAVLSAQDSNGGQVIENVLNLDGEVIYRNQQKVGARRGVNFGMGVFAR